MIIGTKQDVENFEEKLTYNNKNLIHITYAYKKGFCLHLLCNVDINWC